MRWIREGDAEARTREGFRRLTDLASLGINGACRVVPLVARVSDFARTKRCLGRVGSKDEDRNPTGREADRKLCSLCLSRTSGKPPWPMREPGRWGFAPRRLVHVDLNQAPQPTICVLRLLRFCEVDVFLDCAVLPACIRPDDVRLALRIDRNPHVIAQEPGLERVVCHD
jgi:hypothetical protein